MFVVTPIVVSAFISTAVLAINTTIAWRRRRDRMGVYFSLFTAVQTLWGIMVTLGYAAVPLQLKVFFAVMDGWAYRTSDVLVLLFALCFAGYERIAENKWVKAYGIFHILSHGLLISTNQQHGLMWSDFVPQANNVLLFAHGPAFGYTVLTSYLIGLTAMILFASASFRGSKIVRRQAYVILTAFLVQIFLNVAYNLDLFNMPGVDWTSATSAFTNVFVLWALYGYKLLDIAPIARNKLIESLGDGMIALDLQDRIMDVNRSAAEMLGDNENALLGKKLGDVFPRFTPELQNAPEKEVKFELNIGGRRYYDALISPLRDDWPRGIVGRLIILRDTTERKTNELRLLQLTQAVEQSPASVVITDLQGNIAYVNPRFVEVSGYNASELIGRNPRVIQSGQTPLETYEDMWQTIGSGRVWRGELLNKKKNGDLYWELEVVAPVFDSAGQIANYIAIKEEITARKEAEARLLEANARLERQVKEIQALQAELREQAVRDSLTGLHNRHYLSETMEHELARARRDGHPVSFALVDIDRFKFLNDTRGHSTGDLVLKRLAGHLLTFTRNGDIVCRYGGEEFLIVFPNIPEARALQIAERLRAAVQESGLIARDGAISITISIGIAEFPAHGDDATSVLEAADRALYAAKNNGRNRVVLWSELQSRDLAK
ncbi:MAG: hypothetical protein DCC59_01510 [Chloroflexi bacterium]|nr:diguanylate cyclase [Anaerolineales bacterium]RIK55200.1 MAG: hypothetical protein DCC59_01510 [Chloroflexota bacterium]